MSSLKLGVSEVKRCSSAVQRAATGGPLILKALNPTIKVHSFSISFKTGMVTKKLTGD